MKRVGERLTLTRIAWDGPEPVPGDFLVTRTGRRYEILAVRETKLDCRVFRPDMVGPDGSREFQWEWAPRVNGKRGKRRQGRTR